MTRGAVTMRMRLAEVALAVTECSNSDTIQPDYVAWSTFSTIFLNSCCLGFIAYVYSVKSRDRKMVGDMNGAQTYASTAKKLNIIAVVISVVCFIILIILYSAGITSLSYSRHN
eukprot:XP_008758245.1 PREDICTED: interferon-induced transmembrane protein 2 isoform X4 [Rattus norvegicus]